MADPYCYTVDGPYEGQMCQYVEGTSHLLIGGFVMHYYVVTDDMIDTPAGAARVARYFGTKPPPGAEPRPWPWP